MAKTKKPRKQYRGVDAAKPPKVIRIEATPQSKRAEWWSEHKQTIIIRLVLAGIILLVYGLIRLIWSVLT